MTRTSLSRHRKQAPGRRWWIVVLGLAATGCSGGADRSGDATGKSVVQGPVAAQPDSPSPQDAAESPPDDFEFNELRPDPRAAVTSLRRAGARLSENAKGNVVEVEVPETCTDETVEELARLRMLERLTLHEATLGERGLAPVLAAAQLKSLEIGGRGVVDATLAGIEQQRQLKVLRASGTRLDDSALARLHKLPNLEELDVSWTRVTAAGLSHVPAEHLTFLDVSFTSLDDEAIETIVRFQGLKRLVVRGTSISATGAATLKQRLPTTNIEGLEEPPPPESKPAPPPLET